MFRPNSLILYVDDVDRSTAFYRDILKADPVETFQDFSVFVLGEGFVVGLQSKHAIDPKPQPSFGGFELSFSNATKEDVDALHAAWTAKGVEMVLEPTTLEFGYTFVAADPDGHRLRVCATDTTNVT
ncbi:VOC family protein [Pleomorphomonas sp. NRK KF1]|uniref:VOC family protein n=1 Tax=Pleomorphomonas sp. NRK KF1 TaxID=2943000 RepID=UPI0020440F19|nr:VOC family protein [Pleomorphomonas sp. NRK KF1]MCM5553940.1 VOC family protein [Pleomorphomonas sp. NRK KF1]